MTTFLLIRHGAFDGLGQTLTSATPGVGLNAQGRAQVRRLAQRLGERQIDAVYSSPLQRTLDSATLIGQALSLPVEPAPDVQEVNFGEWSGRNFQELNEDKAWQAFHQHRMTTRIPGGEMMLQVQARAVGCLVTLAGRHPDGCVVLVSHADVIRSIVVACLGVGLDAMLRMRVEPASITEVYFGAYPPALVRLNDTAHLFASSEG